MTLPGHDGLVAPSPTTVPQAAGHAAADVILVRRMVGCSKTTNASVRTNSDVGFMSARAAGLPLAVLDLTQTTPPMCPNENGAG